MDNETSIEIKKNTVNQLDSIKHRSEKGFDYWSARELQTLLGYSKWDNFKTAIEKAQMACIRGGNQVTNHFADTKKTVNTGSGAQRDVEDILLTRYACYLIAMNGEPSKPEIAGAQTYFAIQTRKQEISDREDETEDRIKLRDRVRRANKELNSTAKGAGVENYAFFHDAGYKGLYGGLGLSEVKKVKGLHPKEDLMDRAGHAELAANEFRITQAELRLRNQNVKGQKHAEDLHNFVGKEVREAMKRTSGTMPEDLPPEMPIKQLKRSTGPNLPPASP